MASEPRFRFDTFNFLNRTYYNTPVASANAANFGVVSNAQDSG